MLNRSLILPKKSFMLLGPRGTGKSTLIRKNLKANLEIDLLKSKDFLPLLRNPSLLGDWTGHLKPKQWVFIDEVQKIPLLLDEVHALYEQSRLNFALSGSSARKLKRGGANLLAGRAIQVFLYPLVFQEFQNVVQLDDVIEWGSLPLIITDQRYRKQTLVTYVETYLRQELMEEGLIRRLDPFARFLQIAALYHAQNLNIENVARESKVGRTTVDKYFQILEDTLIGFRLPALQEKLRAKETSYPKFYFFDSGVARAAAGLIDETVDSVWKGYSFESLILNELRAYNSYFDRHRSLYHYNVTGSYNIDFLIETKKKTLSQVRELILISVKNSKSWDKRWNDPLNDFQSRSKSKIKSLIGVYRGERILTQGRVTVYPVELFLQELYSGNIF